MGVIHQEWMKPFVDAVTASLVVGTMIYSNLGPTCFATPFEVRKSRGFQEIAWGCLAHSAIKPNCFEKSAKIVSKATKDC